MCDTALQATIGLMRQINALDDTLSNRLHSSGTFIKVWPHHSVVKH